MYDTCGVRKNGTGNAEEIEKNDVISVLIVFEFLQYLNPTLLDPSGRTGKPIASIVANYVNCCRTLIGS